MTFSERAKIGMDQQAKQPPVTLEEMRDQVLRIKISSSSKNKDQDIKCRLIMYHPEWTQKEIDNEFIRLYTLSNGK